MLAPKTKASPAPARRVPTLLPASHQAQTVPISREGVLSVSHANIFQPTPLVFELANVRYCKITDEYLFIKVYNNFHDKFNSTNK